MTRGRKKPHSPTGLMPFEVKRLATCDGRGYRGKCEGPLYDYGIAKGVWCSYHASPEGNPHEHGAD